MPCSRLMHLVPPVTKAASVSTEFASLLYPEHLYERGEALSRPSPVPSSPGVYAWYFRELPDERIHVRACHHAQGLPLLYVGISPKRPPASGPASKQNLRKRIHYHYRGNAAGSTLRLTLGTLLARRLGIELRRVGSGGRLTFATGEAALSDWMGKNALVCWLPTAAPWEVETAVIGQLDLPLNLDQNTQHGLHPVLAGVRTDARTRARSLPVVS